MEQETIFIDGLYSNEVSPKAPDFILANQSIHVEKLSQWLQEHKDLANEKGYINITTKLSRNGKRYIAVDTYKKEETPEEINPDGIPF